MKTTYTIVITALSIVAIILCPEQIREYVMFGLLVMMISINRWEADKILKATNPKTENESEVLNKPRVSGSYPTANDIWSVARTDDMLTFRKWCNKHFGNYR